MDVNKHDTDLQILLYYEIVRKMKYVFYEKIRRHGIMH